MFSVIIPVYNKAHTIKNTIDSVLSQTCQEFEIIIINDGSTDDSLQIINDFKCDVRIRVINQSNSGVSDARNKGIVEAKNEWIAFLDADDEWLPDYLKMVSKTIIEIPSASLILTGRYTQNIVTKERVTDIPSKYKYQIRSINFFWNPHVFAHISATVVKSEYIKQHVKSWGGFISGQKYNEDFLFLFRVGLYLDAAYCGYPLSIYNGGVLEQATTIINKEQKLKDSVLFHNTVLSEYHELNSKNVNFEIFMRYEMRHIFYIKLKEKDYESILYFRKNLSKNCCKMLTGWELTLYGLKSMNKIMQIFIILTKIRWRMYRYPRVNG